MMTSTKRLSPFTTIIIPCYNAERWIVECLDSAIAQTYRPLEIIVIDDGSTDGSLGVIQRYAAQYPDLIRYETGPNRGGCAARDRGFALSKGDYVLFLDADDLLEPPTVQSMVMVLNGRYDQIATCPWWSIEWNGEAWERHFHRYANVSDPLVGELRYGDYVPAQALLWPRSVIEQLGGWDETLWANQDGDLRLRARLGAYPFVSSSAGGFIYRRHSAQSVSGKASRRAMESRMRVLEKVEASLNEKHLLQRYALDLSMAYHRLASGIMAVDEELGERALDHAVRLGGIRSVNGTFRHRILCYTIGLKRKERLARWLAQGPLAGLLGRTRLRRIREA